LDTEAPWFFLWLQGLLKVGDKTLMGVIVPVLLFALLFAAPYLDRSRYRLLRKRPGALLLIMVGGVALAGLSYMGSHRYGIDLPPVTQIMQNLAPEEGIGPLRAVPHDQLVVGVYLVNETDAGSLPPALAEVFSEFERQVNEAAAQAVLPEAEAKMIVEDWQADLKRVTLRIVWTDPENGQRKTEDRIIHLHRYRPR
jgi:hypothetical protein